MKTSAIGVPEFAAIAALLLLYSYAAYYLFGQGVALLQPNFVYLLIYVLSVLVLVTDRRGSEGVAQHSLLIATLASLLVLMALQFIVVDVGQEGLALFVGRVHFLLTFMAMSAILSACTRLDLIVRVVATVVVVSCVINLGEFFLAGSVIAWLSNVPGRAAGFYENSNDSAMFIAMAIPLVALNTNTRARWAFYGLTLAGVYVTFSRGGLIAWALFVAVSELAQGHRRGWGVRAMVFGLGGFVAIGIISLFSTDIARLMTETLWPYLDANTSARIEFLSNDSTQERMMVLERGFEAFAAAPLFGNGVGYTYAWDFPVSVHNMMVLMLAEMGLVGGVWYVLFLWSLWSYGRPYGALAFLVILVTGLFTHNHLERPAVAMAIALYAVAARRTRGAPRTEESKFSNAVIRVGSTHGRSHA